MFKRKTLILVSLLLVLAFLSFSVVFGPFISLLGIRQAIAEDNASKLERYIDFPRLQNNVKLRVQDQARQSLGFEFSNSDNILAQFAIQVADQMIDAAVEGVISPSGLYLMMSGADLNDLMFQAVTEAESESELEAQGRQKNSDFGGYFELLKRSEYQYLNHNTFVFSFSDIEGVSDSGNQKQTELIFYRSGICWKLGDLVFKDRGPTINR
jgi:predicted PurR-regulated permease PerM